MTYLVSFLKLTKTLNFLSEIQPVTTQESDSKCGMREYVHQSGTSGILIFKELKMNFDAKYSHECRMAAQH